MLKDFHKELPPYEKEVLFIWKWKDTGTQGASVGHYRMMHNMEKPDNFNATVYTHTQNFIEGSSLDKVNMFWMEIPKIESTNL